MEVPETFLFSASLNQISPKDLYTGLRKEKSLPLSHTADKEKGTFKAKEN